MTKNNNDNNDICNEHKNGPSLISHGGQNISHFVFTLCVYAIIIMKCYFIVNIRMEQNISYFIIDIWMFSIYLLHNINFISLSFFDEYAFEIVECMCMTFE